MTAIECSHGITVCDPCKYEVGKEMRHLEGVIDNAYEYIGHLEEQTMTVLNSHETLKRWEFAKGMFFGVIISGSLVLIALLIAIERNW